MILFIIIIILIFIILSDIYLELESTFVGISSRHSDKGIEHRNTTKQHNKRELQLYPGTSTPHSILGER